MRAVQELLIMVWVLCGFVLFVWVLAQSLWLGTLVGLVWAISPILYLKLVIEKQ